MKKPVILLAFGITLFFLLREYYRQGNDGLPKPNAIGPAFYAFALLALISDFTGGLTIPLTLGVMTGFLIRIQKTSGNTSVGPKTKPIKGGFLPPQDPLP